MVTSTHNGDIHPKSFTPSNSTPPKKRGRKPLNGAQAQDRKEYQRKYQAKNRHIVCNTIRGTLEDQKLLNQAKADSGCSWLQLLYRGLQIKRPSTIKD